MVFNVCREACINFKELWKKKHADDLWIKEVAAMQSSLPPGLSFSGASGIILANDITTHDQNNSSKDSIPSGDENVETSNSATLNKKEGILLFSFPFFFFTLTLNYIMNFEKYRNPSQITELTKSNNLSHAILCLSVLCAIFSWVKQQTFSHRCHFLLLEAMQWSFNLKECHVQM